MERRFVMRGQVDLPVIQHVDGFAHECRVVNISSRGLVLRQTVSLTLRQPRLIYTLELLLDGRCDPIRAFARRVWTDGPLMAVRYVALHDVDQLEIAEMLDRAHRRGAVLH